MHLVSNFFFFNDTAPTEIYPLSLHDALPISSALFARPPGQQRPQAHGPSRGGRSEEHTSELQSHLNLVCRLLLEKKNIETAAHLSNLRVTYVVPLSDPHELSQALVVKLSAPP